VPESDIRRCGVEAAFCGIWKCIYHRQIISGPEATGRSSELQRGGGGDCFAHVSGLRERERLFAGIWRRQLLSASTCSGEADGAPAAQWRVGHLSAPRKEAAICGVVPGVSDGAGGWRRHFILGTRANVLQNRPYSLLNSEIQFQRVLRPISAVGNGHSDSVRPCGVPGFFGVCAKP
jgi:hypothetical protein